jgi:hypothetical protein
MSPLAAQFVLAAPGASWTKIILVGIFTVGLVLVILIPFVWDIRGAHKAWRDAIKKDPAAMKYLGHPVGVQGIARATMAFAVIAVIGFALAYILVEQPFGNDKTIVQNIIVALTTTLAAISAFYFGSKQATDARNQPKAPPPGPPSPSPQPTTPTTTEPDDPPTT